jgi:hypothetical protein
MAILKSRRRKHGRNERLRYRKIGIPPAGIEYAHDKRTGDPAISTLRDLGAVSEREVSRMSGIGPGALQQLRIYLRKPGPTLELHTRSKAVATIFDAKSLTAIDAWAVDQDIPSRAEAVRRLVELGLRAKAKR